MVQVSAGRESERVKAAARRILSEFRDNYVTRKPFSA